MTDIGASNRSNEAENAGLEATATAAQIAHMLGVTCDAVTYEPVRDADYDMEIRCTEPATIEVVLSDGRPHPRCSQHVPAGFRALGRSL